MKGDSSDCPDLQGPCESLPRKTSAYRKGSAQKSANMSEAGTRIHGKRRGKGNRSKSYDSVQAVIYESESEAGPSKWETSARSSLGTAAGSKTPRTPRSAEKAEKGSDNRSGNGSSGGRSPASALLKGHRKRYVRPRFRNMEGNEDIGLLHRHASFSEVCVFLCV